MLGNGHTCCRGFCRGTDLRCQYEGLHELPHGLQVVGELPHHLHHHPFVQGGVRIHVPYFGVTVPETQRHHPLVDLLQELEQDATFMSHFRKANERQTGSTPQRSYRLSINRLQRFAVAVHTAMHVRRVLPVKPEGGGKAPDGQDT